jgi:hypothetical protein
VLKPKDKLFDEAIFIVSGESGKEVSADEIVRQAEKIAGEYAGARPRRKNGAAYLPVLFAAVGALSASLIWLVALWLL